jgi:hypothetical protein
MVAHQEWAEWITKKSQRCVSHAIANRSVEFQLTYFFFRQAAQCSQAVLDFTNNFNATAL